MISAYTKEAVRKLICRSVACEDCPFESFFGEECEEEVARLSDDEFMAYISDARTKFTDPVKVFIGEISAAIPIIFPNGIK
jgi:hypothetical protein